MEITEKVCKSCNQLLPINSFYFHPLVKTKSTGKCISCIKEYNDKHKEEKKEQKREYDKKRNQLPHRIEARKKYARENRDIVNAISNRWSKNNRKKRNAEQQAYRALLNGKIEKTPCAGCGRTDDLEMHHRDYDKPVEVIFLCHTCHSLEHKQKREEKRNIQK